MNRNRWVLHRQSMKSINNLESLREAWNIGACWWNERISRVLKIRFEKSGRCVCNSTQLQYWQPETWPEPPPKMPTQEDKTDDPWQGQWLSAQTQIEIDQNIVRYTFQPLVDTENKNALFLPGDIRYRRTLKVRLVFPLQPDRITAFYVYSMSHLKNVSLRMELGCGIQKQSTMTGALEIFNGYLENITARIGIDSIPKRQTMVGRYGLMIGQRRPGQYFGAAVPLLPGSNDETIVNASFELRHVFVSVDDLKNGPIYVPYFHAYITNATDPVSFQIQ